MNDHIVNVHVSLLNVMLDVSQQAYDHSDYPGILKLTAKKIASSTGAAYCTIIMDGFESHIPCSTSESIRESEFEFLRRLVRDHSSNEHILKTVVNTRNSHMDTTSAYFPFFVFFGKQGTPGCKIYLEIPTVLNPYRDQLAVLLKTICELLFFIKNHRQLLHIVQSDKSEQMKKLRERFSFEMLIGESDNLFSVMQTIAQISHSEPQVLIEGETGTGKEMIARAIHLNSPRSEQKLLSVNCGAFPENLLEAEFFGFEKGAFTGAFKTRSGKFEQADGATLFLDEIDEMSPALQVKLLRVLQWGEYSPLGSEEIKHCDVRLIAASKQRLIDLVHKGKFRDDLYYRLNTIKLVLLPLRERSDDLGPLTNHFLRKFAKVTNCPLPEIDPLVIFTLKNYAFPGNIRELENLLYRAVILSQGGKIKMEHLPHEIKDINDDIQSPGNMLKIQSFKIAKQEIIENFERNYLVHALKLSQGVVRKAAQISGLHEKNFYEKLNKYNINPRRKTW